MTETPLTEIATKDFAPKVNVKVTSSVTVSEIRRRIRGREARVARQEFVMLWLPGFVSGISVAYLIHVLLTR